MLAGKEQEALVAVVDELCAELGYVEAEELPGAHSPLGGGDGGLMSGSLNPEYELLVKEMRRGLARIAAALGAVRPADRPSLAVEAALDGAELVMRGELVSGNGQELPSLMSSFVFLVALPIGGQDQALKLSQRTSELIEGALRS